jgi:hypothetical protein
VISASQLLYEYMGSPARFEGLVEASGQCWLCGGGLEVGVFWKDWSGSNFVGQNRVKAPGSEYVCPACVYVCSRTSPVPGRPAKEGKKFGGNFRNYSHLFDNGMYLNASKGEKPAILAFLRGSKAGPWFAAIADSGQKHVLPWAPVNPPGTRRGVVLFDEQIVTLPVEGGCGWGIVDKMAGLLTAGATKAEVESGDYTPRAWDLCGDRLRAFEEHWASKRGGSWFALALWLAQRDEEAVAERLETEKESKKARKATNKEKANAPRRTAKRTTEDRNRRSPDVDSGGISGGGSEPAQALEPAPRQDAGSAANKREPGGMVLNNAQDASDQVSPQPAQLYLFAGVEQPRKRARVRV